MRIYFQRIILCEKCGRTERQTANYLPLDWIGRSLMNLHKREFEHKCKINSCKSQSRYTSWKLAKIFNDLKM